MKSGKIDTAPPRGMRDFYPADYRLREHLFGAWRSQARVHGFEFVDAPVVESLELFERKAGEEIADQLYAFMDKGDRSLALRPEFTPSLARMLMARRDLANAPQKWSAIAQCFRYERMSRGRKREHYQWNLDVVNAGGVSAEVEVLATACAALRELGLDACDYVVLAGSRRLLSELYVHFELPAATFEAWCRIIDKRDKVQQTELNALLAEIGFTTTEIERTAELMAIDTLTAARRLLGESTAVAELETFFALCETAGLANIVQFDPGIVRGLAYYTGIVFEAFDRQREFRAIFGGGRYENLLQTLGGPSVPCVGLGFGDVVVLDVLQSRGRIPDTEASIDCAVGYQTDACLPFALSTATSLRNASVPTDLSTRGENARSFFRRADRINARFAIYVGPREVEVQQAEVKDLQSGETIAIADLLHSRQSTTQASGTAGNQVSPPPPA